MSNETVVVLTFESIDRILNDGGTSEWRLDRNRARRCAFVVCTRNSNAKPSSPVKKSRFCSRRKFGGQVQGRCDSAERPS